MKAALLINRDNFDAYSDWKDINCELIHLGGGEPDVKQIIATGADVLVVGAMTKVGPEIIENMPGLKLVQSQGVGFNFIDLDCARAKNVYVCNNAGINAQAVAEQTILLILALIKNFRYNEEMIYEGKMHEAQVACFKDGLPELCDLCVGIVGYGAIGRAAHALLKPFGCRVTYYDNMGDLNVPDAEYVPLEKLYASCDIISLNLPVTPETKNMINNESLKHFKPGAILINTARGDLMDHEAVARALISGQLGGLGADTLAPEPVQLDNPFLVALPKELRCRVALSPHIGGITASSFRRAFVNTRKNIEAIARGERPNCIVNGL